VRPWRGSPDRQAARSVFRRSGRPERLA
jgi:hypothetical protein